MNVHGRRLETYRNVFSLLNYNIEVLAVSQSLPLF